MKKFLILAATVALSAACSHNFEVNPVSKDGGQIGFGTWAENLTRVDAPSDPRGQGSSSFTTGDSFSVYGTKVLTPADSIIVFNGIEVVNTDGTNWDYDHHRFWDKNAVSYAFYAVSPSSVSIASADAKSGNFTSGSITFTGVDSDILVADSVSVLNANFTASNYKVPMNFNHIASLVDLKVKKHADIGDATVAITSVSLTNIDNKGTFSVSYGASKSPVITWAKTSSTGNYSAGVNPVDLATAANDINTTGVTVIDSLVVMPQTFRTDGTNQTVNIEYTITPNGGAADAHSVSFDLKEFDNTDNNSNASTLIGEWEPGKHYTLYITINANAIMFTATISEWTVGTTGYHYLLD